jgi:sugar/nucleoside kinase (ribokinase family)
MTIPYDILTFGDMCVDLILSGDDITPRFGQVEQLVGDYFLEMGGSACLFACQAARLGLRTAVLGKVGPDLFGELALHRLAERGVDTRHITVDPGLKTGLGLALVKGGDRAILTYPGSLDAITPDDVSTDLLASARHLHHGSYFLQTRLRPAIPEIFRRAQESGMTTSLDTNWDPAERWDGGLRAALSHTDIFLPNRQELERITGVSGLEAGLHAVHDLGAPVVAVKLGPQGACASDGERLYRCRVTPVDTGDSVGAGDSFDAGFVAGRLQGHSLPECLQLACAGGRAVAGAVGGLAGQPDWTAIKTLAAGLEITTKELP